MSRSISACSTSSSGDSAYFNARDEESSCDNDYSIHSGGSNNNNNNNNNNKRGNYKFDDTASTISASASEEREYRVWHRTIHWHDWDRLEALLKAYTNSKRNQCVSGVATLPGDNDNEDSASGQSSPTTSPTTTPTPKRKSKLRVINLLSLSKKKQQQQRAATAAATAAAEDSMEATATEQQQEQDQQKTKCPLLQLDEYGRTPLHIACQEQESIPQSLFVKLIFAERKATMVSDDNGQQPLHYAVSISTYTPRFILDNVVRGYPPALSHSDANGQTPLLLAIQQVQAACQNQPQFGWGATMSQEHSEWKTNQIEQIWSTVQFLLDVISARRKHLSSKELSCIFSILKYGAPPTIVDWWIPHLLTAQQQQQRQQTQRNNNKPPSAIFTSMLASCLKRQYPLPTIKLILDNIHGDTSVYDIYKAVWVHYQIGVNFDYPQTVISSRQQSIDMALCCSEWWTTLKFLLTFCAAYVSSSAAVGQIRDRHLLSVATAIPYCPASLISLLSDMFPSSSKIPDLSSGRLPIHNACSLWKVDMKQPQAIMIMSLKSSSSSQQQQQPSSQASTTGLASYQSQIEDQQQLVVKACTQHDVTMVRMRYQGRLPLHLAIASGMWWSFLQELIYLDPLTVTFRDPQTKLYPFQLAALPLPDPDWRGMYTNIRWNRWSESERANAMRKIQRRQELDQLSSIYELIKQNPYAVQGFPVQPRAKAAAAATRTTTASTSTRAATRPRKNSLRVSSAATKKKRGSSLLDRKPSASLSPKSGSSSKRGASAHSLQRQNSAASVQSQGTNNNTSRSRKRQSSNRLVTGQHTSRSVQRQSSYRTSQSRTPSPLVQRRNSNRRSQSRTPSPSIQRQGSASSLQRQGSSRSLSQRSSRSLSQHSLRSFQQEQQSLSPTRQRQDTIPSQPTRIDFTGVGIVAGHYLRWCYQKQSSLPSSSSSSSSSWEPHSSHLFILRHLSNLAIASEDDMSQNMKTWWNIMKVYIWYCVPQPLEVFQFPVATDEFLLHAALLNPDTPPLVIHLVLRLFPSSACKDYKGAYPLQIAASTDPYVPQPFEEEQDKHLSSMALVLQAYPKAAHVIDNNGRHALHIALANGKTCWKTQLEPLVQANPNALFRRDFKTKMFPFQMLLAAAATTRANKRLVQSAKAKELKCWNEMSSEQKREIWATVKEQDTRNRQTSAFEMLRRNPSLISWRRRNCRRHHYYHHHHHHRGRSSSRRRIMSQRELIEQQSQEDLLLEL